MDRDTAILRMMMLRDISGEYVSERDDYMCRFNEKIPSSVPRGARKEVEEIGGVDYVKTALAESVFRRLKEHPPFKTEYELFNERFAHPEDFFNIMDKGLYVQTETYYIDFKNSKVLEEKNHEADGKIYAKEFLIDRKGEKWKMLLRPYRERPPWRGLAWKYEDVKDIPVDMLYMAMGMYLKARELFPEVSFGVRKFKYAGAGVKIVRVFADNPILGKFRRGYLVEITRGKKVERIFEDKKSLSEIEQAVKDMLNGKKEKKMEKKGGVEIGN